MSRGTSILATILLVGAVVPTAALGQDPKAEFLRLYTPHAAKTRDAFTNITCKDTTTWYGSDSKATSITESQAKYNFRNFALEGSIRMLVGAAAKAGNVSQGVECQNPRYSFTLAGTGAKRVLSEYRPVTAEVKSTLCPLCVPYADQAVGRSYLDIVKDPATKVISLGDATWRGKTTKRLVLEFASPDPVTKKLESGRCTYYFLPELQWVCYGSQSFDPPNSDKVAVEEVFEYESQKGALPVLKSTEQWVYGKYTGNPAVKERLNRRTEVADFQRSKVPFKDSEFTLTAYGFPEPEGLPAAAPAGKEASKSDALAVPDAGATSAAGWLWAAAIGFLFLSVVFFKLRARTLRRAVAAKSQAA